MIYVNMVCAFIDHTVHVYIYRYMMDVSDICSYIRIRCIRDTVYIHIAFILFVVYMCIMVFADAETHIPFSK